MGDIALKKKILIIEDEEDTRKSVVSMLSRAGYEVESAVDGEEALVKAKERHFDLFFLDIHLPGISGLEVFRNLKQLNPMAKVCIMTGWPKGLDAQKEDYLALVREGAVDKMLRKPFGKNDILDAAKALI